MRDRSRGRGWALQALYAWEARGGKGSPVDMLDELGRERTIAESSRTYAQQLLREVDLHRSGIDRRVQDSLSNWRLDRLAFIDRNILRLAVAEMLYIDDVPPRVSIQEAIHLAEKYGTSESPRFVNGVLDALMHDLESGDGDGE